MLTSADDHLFHDLLAMLIAGGALATVYQGALWLLRTLRRRSHS